MDALQEGNSYWGPGTHVRIRLQETGWLSFNNSVYWCKVTEIQYNHVDKEKKFIATL